MDACEQAPIRNPELPRAAAFGNHPPRVKPDHGPRAES